MIDLVGLASVGVAFFVVAASPGPATLAAATVSMRAGRASGLRFGAGLSVGLAFWGMVAATGLGAVLQSSTYALTALKIFGGGYLLWLAYKTARSASQKTTPLAPRVSHGQWFRRGLVLNLSNPKAVVAWMATLSLGLGHSAGIWQVVLATSLCVALGFLIYFVYAITFSLPRAMGGYARVQRWVDGTVSALFAIAGVALLRSAFSR